MSIPVSCQCGKRFKAGDSAAGKRTKCPSCGQPLTIPKPPATIEPDIFALAENDTEVFQPSEAPAPVAMKTKSKGSSLASSIPTMSKSSRGKDQPITASRVSISPGMIVLIILAIIIPAAIFWAKNGPMKAHADWARIEPIAESNIVGEVTHAIMQKYSEAGFDLRDTKMKHEATGCFFDDPAMMLSLPDSVHVQGNSTEGKWRGEFHPKTWRFEIDIDIMDKPHHVTGNASEDKSSVEIDGEPLK